MNLHKNQHYVVLQDFSITLSFQKILISKCLKQTCCQQFIQVHMTIIRLPATFPLDNEIFIHSRRWLLSRKLFCLQASAAGTQWHLRYFAMMYDYFMYTLHIVIPTFKPFLNSLWEHNQDDDDVVLCSCVFLSYLNDHRIFIRRRKSEFSFFPGPAWLPFPQQWQAKRGKPGPSCCWWHFVEGLLFWDVAKPRVSYNNKSSRTKRIWVCVC